MVQQFNPFVYWAQTESHATLKVDLKDVKEPNIELRNTQLSFSSQGVGARGLHEYSFALNFYSDIDLDGSSYKVTESKVFFQLKKVEAGWWTRFTSQPQKPHWLKIDFDRWRSEEDNDDDDDDENVKQRDIMKDYPKMYDQLHKEEFGYKKEKAKTVYLVLYNLLQFIGFLYIIIVMSIQYYRDGASSIPDTFKNVGNAIKFCQLLQYLEVMHPIFGYTRGGALVPFLQVTGRSFVLFIMIDYEERMQTKPVVFYLFYVWSLIEIVRYPYYLSQLLKFEFKLLTWLRYTIWIPLYPLGVLCEFIIILRNIPYFSETNRFSMELPNKWNFTFHMPTFLYIYLLLLILPGIYFMMTHMSAVRSKKLGTKRWKKH